MSEFKVGYLVVFTDKDSVTGLYQVEMMGPHFLPWMIVKVGHVGTVRVNKKHMRLATKEEIKAGRRLP